jgi:MFS superfamily sulfate permease-like transporter
MVDSAGGRSQLAQFGTVAIVLAVLLFLTGPLAYLPNAVLASIVFLIALKLINLKELKSIRVARPREFLLAIVTALTVVVVGVEQGILLAILLSLLQHVRKSYQPLTGVIHHDEKEKWKVDKVSGDVFIEPGIVIYWFGAELFYANSNHFSDEIRWIINQTKPNLAWLVVDTGGVGSIDYSAGRTLKELHDDLKDMNIVLALTRVDDDFRTDLRQLGLLELIGPEKMFYTRTACLEHYRTVIGKRN